ncbi:MAG: B12-binding domain-containing radical SAM protein [Myxococcota bacterium]
MARVLLVYANPAITATPVSPYGAERIAHALRIAGCEVRLVAPWLEPAPRAAVARALDWKPDLVGFSIRNVDDALVVRAATGRGDLDTAFYLPAVRPLVRLAQARGVPVLVGGAAVSSMPEAVLRYLGVRHGIAGPADDLAWRLGRALASGVPFPAALPDDPRVVDLEATRPRARGDAAAWRPVPGPTPRMAEYMRLARARDGRVPVLVTAGCDRRCTFCVEASFLGWQVRARPADEIVHEIGLLARAGVRRVWLAASELNVPDGRHAVAVLRAVAAAGLAVDVTGFLQPAPADDALLDAFAACGVDPAGLSWELGHLDDRLLRKGAGPANRAAIDRLVALYARRGHRTLGGSVLLGAHPEETYDHVDAALAVARELDAALPDGLGLAWAAGGRVYPNAPLGRWVRAHLAEARPHLYGRWTPDFVAPLVFCRPASPRALFAYVEAGLAGCRGQIRPLNAEATGDPRVERWVNLAIVRDDPAGAVRAARAALRLDPRHPEALRQLALLLANRRGDAPGALDALRRLAEVVAGDPVRAGEVARAIAQIEAACR